MRTGEIGRNAPQKTVWWKVDLGRVHNIYSINIAFKSYDSFGMRVLLQFKLKLLNNDDGPLFHVSLTI